jgi:hypothetical protein
MIEVMWEDTTYVVEQDGEFIKDDDNLYFAIKFALEVAVASPEFHAVTVSSVE